ncbi:LCP family protein [Streptomyces sp. G-G2]|uniref:LCP family protein n=1 Tax=Streptomyces sp. G-G2 TaxID=3046201 RepID=UPI0024BAEF8A|nr:LCP family protein [Streptomyces sp. G-G2]MDJ0384657.1 LCP family protein [Streptomyces sp. G-G2]
MNDRQEPYDPYAGQEQQLIGYDAYGQPVYGPVPAQEQYQQYDYQGYDQRHQQQQQQYYYQQQQQQQQQQTQQWIPQQSVPEQATAPEPAPAPAPDPAPGPAVAQVPEPRRADEYHTAQFAFIDQPDEDSEDVIDWLAFTESRTERREEARRRGKNRVVALIVVLALFVVGGLGYLWYAGGLPFLDGPQKAKGAAAPTGPQKRDMIVVHLHNTKRGGTSTALLVDNVTTKQGATVLLPNTLTVPKDDGTSTGLGKSVEEDGLGGTREALDSMLGTRIGGTWRLDTPFLERLVELVGGIEVDTDAAVPADDQVKTPAVGQGAKQTLSGPMAVAYATYRGQGEPEAKQLERFGKVLYAVLRKMPSDPAAATVTVETLTQILDPSLNEKALGSSLAKLAEHAKAGDYRTEVLPVKPDGALTDDANKKVVREVLGGTVTAPKPGTAPRVGLRDASGSEKTQLAAKAALQNGGYDFVDGGKAPATQSASQITYEDDAQKAKAVDVAKTLGLPETVVKKAENAVNADVVVTLGKDYKAL